MERVSALGQIKVIKVHSANVVSFIVSNIVSLTVFEILDAKILSPRSMTVQSHPRSKVMLLINSPWGFCSTSIDPIIVSITVFEIFDV